MSGTSTDGGAESDPDQFMSLPGTPTADDGAFFWKGESVHDYLVFWWLISATVPRPRSFPRIGARLRNVPRALYAPRYSEW
jgi:hypothetical protein